MGALLLFVIGYFGVGLASDHRHARGLATSLDAKIPFVADSIWVYLAVFPAALLPLFLVRCPRLFRRTVASYGAAFAVSMGAFVAFPVTSSGLRVDPATLDPKGFSTWGVAWLYRLDPPYNLFPSLHLAIALLSAASAWKASRAYGAAALGCVVPIALSILTVKQHFVVDGLGGVAVAAVAYATLVRPYEPRGGSDPAYGWRGPAGYVLACALAFAGLYAGFLLAA